MLRIALALALAALALAAGCSGDDGDDGGATTRQTTTAAGPPFAALYDYDRDAPLGYRRHGLINKNYPVKVYDVSYASPRGGRVTAALVLPPGEGPYPAVVYLHGSGGSRLEMVVPATFLAGRRAVALSIDASYARTPRPQIPSGIRGLRKQRELDVQTVVDLRRAIDVLASLPQVDHERIGLVGYSAGGKSAAIAAGLDDRFKAIVLMAAGAPSIEPFVEAAPVDLRPEVRELLASTDPARFIGHAKGAVLIQFGTEDDVVAQDDLEAMGNAATDATVLGYPGGHDVVINTRVIRDQIDFLADDLGIDGPPVPGALTTPPR